jgi:hypothetical protein
MSVTDLLWRLRHLKLTFVAEKPPPSRFFEPVVLAAAERSGDYF